MQLQKLRLLSIFVMLNLFLFLDDEMLGVVEEKNKKIKTRTSFIVPHPIKHFDTFASIKFFSFIF